MTIKFQGVLAGATVDHLLVDVPLHITLCDKNPKGRVLCEISKDISIYDIERFWENSTRQCKWCAKRLEKIQGRNI